MRAGLYDEKRSGFDPADVDWAELMTLYQDDPLLMAIFEGLKARFGFDPSDTYLSTRSTLDAAAGAILGGVFTTTQISSSSSSVSPSLTLKWDTAGNANITTTDLTEYGVTWSTDEE